RSGILRRGPWCRARAWCRASPLPGAWPAPATARDCPGTAAAGTALDRPRHHRRRARRDSVAVEGDAVALLLTGRPGVGKTTVIRAVANRLPRSRLAGFVTEEIRVRGERRGFALVTLDGRRRVIAHVDREGPRVGKYGVDVETLEALARSALEVR